jgi:large subunit ribosomal protein L25
MVVDVPVVLRGTPPGVTAGGVLDHHMHTVSVEAPAVQIPDQLEVRVLDLQIGDAIYVRDVQLPPDVRMMDDPDQVVVQVNEPVEMPEEEGAELEATGAEPELVGRKDEDDEAGDAD